MTGVFSEKKADINSGTGKIDSETNDIAEFDIWVWDGKTIGGKALKKLMYELYDTIRENSFLLEAHVRSLDRDLYLIFASFSRLPKPATITILYHFYEDGIDQIVPTGIYKGKVEEYQSPRAYTALIFTQQK